MAFTAQDVKDNAQSLVDAEGGQYYLDQQDWIPAINMAYQRALTACRWELANRSGAEEQLSELKVDLLFRSNGIGVVDLGHAKSATNPATENPFKPWSIVAVYAEPTRAPLLSTAPPTPLPIPANGSLSYYWDGGNTRPVGSAYPVQRMTAEQLAVATTNQYMSGNETLALNSQGQPGHMRSYAYAIAGDQQSINDNIPGDSPNLSIIIKPFALSSNQWFWISYLKEPNTITAMTGSNTGTILFPKSFLRTIADWTLYYLSIKQGDGTTLNSTAQQDAMALFQYTS